MADTDIDIHIAIVEAPFEILKVNVSTAVGDLSEALTLSGTNATGSLSLKDLPQGTNYLIATIEDAMGNVASKRQKIIIDRKPILTVNKPLRSSVASPELPVEASCVDETHDCKISVSVRTNDDSQLITSSENNLDQTLDLSAYNGQEVTISISSAGDRPLWGPTVTRKIFVEAWEKLTKINDLPGDIIDFNGERSLIYDNTEAQVSLSIYDMETGVQAPIEVPDGLDIAPAPSMLTSTGAIYAGHPFDSDAEFYYQLYDWNNATLYDLGNPSNTLRVLGDFAIWKDRVTDKLIRRQFSTAENKTIIDMTERRRYNLATNGMITHLSDDYHQIINNDGETAFVITTNDISFRSDTEILSDGSGFIYTKTPIDNNFATAIVFHDGINETVLTDFRGDIDDGKDYQINNGWVAFTKRGNLNQTHIWTRTVEGNLSQRTFFGNSKPTIETLSRDGQVMLFNDGNRYLSEPDGQLTKISSSLGKSYLYDGTWYIAIGRSLFKVQ